MRIRMRMVLYALLLAGGAGEAQEPAPQPVPQATSAYARHLREQQQNTAETAGELPATAVVPVADNDGDKPSATEHKHEPAGPDMVEPTDPFSFSVSSSSEDGYLPTSRAQVPAGIRVMAILRVEDNPPLAVLEVPGRSGAEIYFVRENDVILIDHAGSAGGQVGRGVAAPARTGAQPAPVAAAESNAHFYILVSRILYDHVEIAPRMRPEDARIIR